MSNGSTTWTYAYNADGLRTSRTNGTTAYSYVYNGSTLSQMTVDTNVLTFSYDANGLPMAVNYNGTEYYYVTNVQSDIIAILDSIGNTVVTYSYDAWGNILSTDGTLSTTLGAHNPLRYRGYVYDNETGLYYLQSRSYCSDVGRFINTDIYPTTGQGFTGNNMFAYCGNNPVSRVDAVGTFWGQVLLGAVVGGIIGAAAELTAQIINNAVTGDAINWGDVATSAVGGAVYGAVMTATGNSAFASAASEGTTTLITGIRNGNSAEEIMLNTAGAVTGSFVTAGANKFINNQLSGKFLRLGPVGETLKFLTSDHYFGRFSSSNTFLPESIKDGLESAFSDFIGTSVRTIYIGGATIIKIIHEVVR